MIDQMSETDDPVVAERVAAALDASPHTFDDVRVEVRDGFVTLTGAVDWQFQQRLLRRTVENLEGVGGVADLTVLRRALHRR